MSIMKRNYRIRRQCEGDIERNFTCGDSDLDDFFKNDSLHYSVQKLATSYVVEGEDALLAYFSIANDSISIEDFYKSSSFNRFRKRFANAKRLKGTFYKKQRSACRFLLVDAYRESVDFYLKNGFTPIDDMPDLQKHTIPMYFDLADMDIH